MRNVMSKHNIYSYVEFETLLCNIERVLNSRPLTYLNSAHATDPIITPALLIGSYIIQNESNLNSIYEFKCHVAKEFWKLFCVHYVANLRERITSRITDGPQPNIGDVVLMHEPNLPLWHWPTAMVHELLISKDGKVRKALVKTTKNMLVERNISHLVPLEAQL